MEMTRKLVGTFPLVRNRYNPYRNADWKWMENVTPELFAIQREHGNFYCAVRDGAITMELFEANLSGQLQMAYDAVVRMGFNPVLKYVESSLGGLGYDEMELYVEYQA